MKKLLLGLLVLVAWGASLGLIAFGSFHWVRFLLGLGGPVAWVLFGISVLMFVWVVSWVSTEW